MRHQPTFTYVQLHVEPPRPYKRRKKHSEPHTLQDMNLFSQNTKQYLMPPAAPTRKRSQRFLKTEVDEFLSSDLEISFASTVSLNSPPKSSVPLTPDRDYAEPMDISPLPPPKPAFNSTQTPKSASRPRSYTSGPRLFGNDLSNNMSSLLPSAPISAAPSLKSNSSTQSSNKRIQRAGLPTEWISRGAEMNIPEPIPASPADDAMDVDSSFSMSQEVVAPLSFSPAPQTAAATVTTFNTLFYNTVSPRRSFESPLAHQKKRRSISPDMVRPSEYDPSSSPGLLPPSPSEARADRLSNGKPMLQGLGAPSMFAKRGRRPVQSAMITSVSPVSANPMLQHTNRQEDYLKNTPPVRRAFSALIPPAMNLEFSEDSFEGPDMSSPAQAYSKRQQVRTLRRCDGSESLRATTGASTAVARESPGRLMGSPYSKYMAPGLGGFGDNEAHGKLLPCHKVTEDGLMRITAQTLDNLIDGKFDDRINDYHIIDCRFDYEYSGGHVPGAVNINTTQAVEELLLGPSLTKPKPSVSGDPARKTILVFHCEFSAKRAPTFAKHLRAKDRAMNNAVYPKIHYPEIYVLEGGYCSYFKLSSHRCQPPAYVRMDDPNHAVARREDLDQFRKVKFGRHKSYAYGEGASKPSAASAQQVQMAQSKRMTAPTDAGAMFAAANAARGRRTISGPLTTLAEDAANTTNEADDTDVDIGDSPCPPPTKTMLKGKRPGRGTLTRSETYGPNRLALGC